MKSYTEYYDSFVHVVGEEDAKRLASMCRYIDKTGSKEDTDRYQMLLGEVIALQRLFEGAGADTICLAFDYGRAKGYRAAQNAARKETRT